MEMKISFRFEYCQKEARILILYVGGIILAKWKECIFLSHLHWMTKSGVQA